LPKQFLQMRQYESKQGEFMARQVSVSRRALTIATAITAAPLIPGLPGAPARAAEADSGPPQLEEVVVTATKREQTVREIPASIVALSGDRLEQQGAQSVEDFARLVPGVNLTTPGDSAMRITIRGIAAEAGTNPTAGLLFGDVSFSDAYLPRVTLDPNPFDLASVEVLKGPQGTLFGAGALNGAIRYVPMAPEYGQWQAKYFADYTSLQDGGNGATLGAALNVPLGEKVALRVVGLDRTAPGWVDNLITGRKDVNSVHQGAGRAGLSYEPTDRLEVRLTYAWQKTDLDDLPVTDNRNGDLTVSNKPRASPSKRAYDLTSLSLRDELDWAAFVSETAYVRKRSANFVDASSRVELPPPFPQEPLEAQLTQTHSATWSQELRLVSVDSPQSAWRWVAGVFGSHQHITQATQVPLGDPTLDPTITATLLGPIGSAWFAFGQPHLVDASQDVTIKELAAFGDVTRKFGSAWELSVGGRLYKTTSGGSSTQQGLLLLLGGFNPPQHTLTGEVRENGFSPKASLLWHATDHVIGYGAISRGFRIGGIQPYFSTPGAPTAAPETFKSDTIWNYELGARTDWLERTLRFDLTGFYEKWKDPQTLVFSPGQLLPYLDNVGGVTSKGAESTLQYLFPLQGLSLTASATYTHTATTEALIANGQAIPAGSVWPLSPKWQTATQLSYQREVGEWNLGASVTHSFIGKAIYGLSQPDRVFGYQQWDVQVSVASIEARWLPELTFTVNNLGDVRGISNAFHDVTYNDVTYIQPRSYSLRLSGKF